MSSKVSKTKKFRIFLFWCHSPWSLYVIKLRESKRKKSHTWAPLNNFKIIKENLLFYICTMKNNDNNKIIIIYNNNRFNVIPNPPWLLLKGQWQWQWTSFLYVLHKSLWPRSLTLPFKPFRFWLRILGDIRFRKSTPRIGESGNRQDQFFSNL